MPFMGIEREEGEEGEEGEGRKTRRGSVGLSRSSFSL